jgi:hypothetical protein
MADVYEQHRASFPQVSAYVIARNGERVGSIAFKFPKDGAGRLLAYVHFFGAPMVRGYASGYGYDKKTAACASASRRMETAPDITDAAAYAAFREAISRDGGHDWDSTLRRAGFDVWQAV